MKIQRKWAMPNSSTFEVKPIADLIGRYIKHDEHWLDPFCGDSRFAEYCITNDLNPDKPADYHCEALDLMREFEGETFDGVLFDPPYSKRQISEAYKGIGMEVHQSDTQSSFYGDRKREAARLLKPGGIAICAAWNSGGLGKCNDMELIEVLLVPHGGAHYDTIVTVERKGLDQQRLM